MCREGRGQARSATMGEAHVVRGTGGSFVEGRTRLAVGGGVAVAASIAVVCAVALTTSASLADTPGATAYAGGVVVPAAPTPSPPSEEVLTPAPAPVDVVESPELPADEPETVPAPAPVDLAADADRGGAAISDAPGPADEEQVLADAVRSGDWDTAYAWALGQGWSAGRLQSWLARLESLRADQFTAPAEIESSSSSHRVAEIAAGSSSASSKLLPEQPVTPGPQAQSERRLTEGSPPDEPADDRPAERTDHASEHVPSGLAGPMRERSQVPPD